MPTEAATAKVLAEAAKRWRPTGRTRPARPNYSLTSMGRERMLVGSSDDSEASSDEASEGAAVPATEPARIPPVESTPVVTDQAVVTAVPPATKL